MTKSDRYRIVSKALMCAVLVGLAGALPMQSAQADDNEPQGERGDPSPVYSGFKPSLDFAVITPQAAEHRPSPHHWEQRQKNEAGARFLQQEKD